MGKHSQYIFSEETIMNENRVFRANARAQLGGSIFANNWLMALVVCLV